MNDVLRKGLALAVLSAAMGTPVEAQVADWAQWRGSARDGIAPCTTWASTGAAEPLWRRNVGRGYSSVCLRAGNLITHGYDATAEQDVVVCLDPLTGEERWRHAYPAKVLDNMHGGGTLTTPVASGDNVFVLSRMGTLWCLALDDGAVKWKRVLTEADGIEIGAFGLPSTPLLRDDGTMVINVGKTMLLEQATGKQRWATKDYGYSYSVPVEATLNDRPTLVVFNAAGLVTLNPSTGDELSQFEWTSQYNVNCATPIVVDDKVFISTGYNDKGCAMLDFSGGAPAVEWKSMVMSSKMTGCVLFEDHLYGFDDSILRCIDLSGKRKWQQRGFGVGALLVSADGRLIIMSEDGELVTARATPDEFVELSRRRVFEEGGKCWTTPVLSDGLIYCRNSLGELVCLDHRSK